MRLSTCRTSGGSSSRWMSKSGEYRILDDLLRYSSQIGAMVIEFHMIDLVPELFISLIRKIKRNFHIVHIRNNNEALTSFDFPWSSSSRS